MSCCSLAVTHPQAAISQAEIALGAGYTGGET